MDEPEIRTTSCPGCGKPMAHAQGDQPLCPVCRIGYAEQFIQPDASGTAESARRRPAVRAAVLLQVAVIGICGAVIVIRLPDAVASIRSRPKVVPATFAPNAALERCATNTWYLTAEADAAARLDTTLTCPVSGKLYVIRDSSGVHIVACPTPEAHGRRGIRCDSRVTEPRAW
jgi:hypothetical protein